MSGASSSTIVFLTSLLCMPLCFMCNFLHHLLPPVAIFGIVVCSLTCMIVLIHCFRERGNKVEQLYYVFAMSCFISVIDLLVGLENDDFIGGFVRFYLQHGEPYLKTAHGTLICYWDGVLHYGMYLTMLAAMSWGQSYREVGLVWCGSMVNSVVVLLLGNLLGKYSGGLLFLFNFVYLLVPIYALVRLMQQRSFEPVLDEEEVSKYHKFILRRPLDMLCILFLLFNSMTCVFRGCAVLPYSGNYGFIIDNYTNLVEPYLSDPVSFPKIQVLLYMFYAVPYFCCCIYALCVPANRWMGNWSLVFLGAIAQGQFSSICASFHSRTPYLHRVRGHGATLGLFWLVNLSLVMGQALLTWRCHQSPQFFSRAKPPVQVVPRKRSVIQNPYLKHPWDKKDS